MEDRFGRIDFGVDERIGHSLVLDDGPGEGEGAGRVGVVVEPTIGVAYIGGGARQESAERRRLGTAADYRLGGLGELKGLSGVPRYLLLALLEEHFGQGRSAEAGVGPVDPEQALFVRKPGELAEIPLGLVVLLFDGVPMMLQEGRQHLERRVVAGGLALLPAKGKELLPAGMAERS